LCDTLYGSGGLVPEPETPAMLTAMGPGFCAELVLLQW
jgi:predicted naringenin-chalcone synthase